MSKGLEALKELKENVCYFAIGDYAYPRLDLIETELKRYSKIEELCGQTIFDKDCINEIIERTVDECLINENKLKALEIIKSNFRMVGNCLHIKNKYAENGWDCVKELEDDEEYDAWEEVLK